MKFLFSLIAQFFRWLASRNEYASTPDGQREKQAERDKAEAAEKQAAAKAVRAGDADTVNRKLKDLYGAVLLSLCLLSLAAGCRSTVTYVPQSEAAVPMEYDGKPGWWVPEGIFALMLEDAITLKNIRRLERSQTNQQQKEKAK